MTVCIEGVIENFRVGQFEDGGWVYRGIEKWKNEKIKKRNDEGTDAPGHVNIHLDGCMRDSMRELQSYKTREMSIGERER